MEPRCNDPRYNDVPGITVNILCPRKSYSKMYGTEPRYIEDITWPRGDTKFLRVFSPREEKSRISRRPRNVLFII